ncbi:hypothetical protein GCM10009123_01450 [Kangiella japonica]|uniref:Uncharacterized protein n=1 Tax=Kangiella japonica TaxID=647384 RepID=A0ABP3CCW9_9GAMM
MAKLVPNTVIHQGNNGGRAKAKSQAVTKALPSHKMGAIGLLRIFRINASVNNATEQAIIKLISTP